jgi:CheY-like chemotaxis protein/CBS domain-containing protein
MDTLAHLVDRRDPLSPDETCDAVLARFLRESDAACLAVVEDGRPVGLVSREAFIARLESPSTRLRPVRELMDEHPTIAAADTLCPAFAQSIIGSNAQVLLTGFIVVDEAGAYLGVGSALGLIGASLRRFARRREETSLLQRLAREVRGQVESTLAVTERLRKARLAEEAYLDTIDECSGGILELLDNASELQRAELGRNVLTLETRRLQDLMDEVEGRWSAKAETAGVTLLVAYDGDPDCSAQVDAPRVLQVFDALIAHSLAHVRHGVVEVALKARADDAGIAIEGRVRDTGAVYADGYLAQLFDPAAPQEEGGGGLAVRLGLALADRTVQAMGARLTAQPNVGAGATMGFSATLSAGGLAEAESTAPEADAVRSAHILVVDDNATNRMVVEALCEMFDCSTESVEDGLEAVEAARAGRFDIVLMDIKMPRMDGVSATREIRKLAGPAGQVPIIALTANADPDEVAEYIAAGMCAVVEKPIKPERLMEALDAVLSQTPAEGGGDAAAAA